MKDLVLIMKEFDRYEVAEDTSNIIRLRDEVIDLAEKTCNNSEKVHLYYSVVTAYGNLYRINYKRYSDAEKEENIENQIYYSKLTQQSMTIDNLFDWYRLDEYQETIELVNKIFEDNNINSNERQIYSQFLINLGNCYSSIYRPIDALYCYKKSLIYVPDSSMAIANKGLALGGYSDFFLNDKNHVLKKLSYINTKRALENKEYLKSASNVGYEFIENSYNKIRDIYKNNLDWLEEPLITSGISGNDESEIKYKTWVASKGFYLNPYNDDNNYMLSTDDILHLPNMIFKIDEDVYKYIGLFNQIKQEYASTRYLFYVSSENITDVHYSDRGNLILNTLDYTNETYYDFLQKNCFKSLLSILDRIAFFINEYFDLGIEQSHVSFSSIWKNEKSGRNPYKYKNDLKIIKKTNNALNGLYWLAKDIQQSNYNNKSIKPYLFDYKDFRNYLEHKYVKTSKDLYISNESRQDSLAYYITEIELYTSTNELLRLVRAIIITLIASIDRNEQLKREKIKQPYIPIIDLDIIEDEWKK